MVTSREDELTARGHARIFYGWVVLGVVCVASAISMGPRSVFSVFLLAFLEEFGWSRAAAAAVFSIHMTSYALGGWVLGVLVDRCGPRRVMAWSTGAWCLILLLSSRIRSLWQLYALFGLLGGLATGGLAYVPTNALLSRWFVRYRGLATGFSQTGSPLGIVMFGSLTQLAITALGWRNTYLAFGLLVGVTSLPLILLFLRDTPREMGLDPDGIPAPASASGRSGHRAPGAETSYGRRLPPGYWTVFCANVLRGVVMNALLVHQVAYLVDVGFTKLAAASYFALSSLLAVLGGCAAGAISDRLGRARAYAGIAALYLIGISSLLLVRGPSQVLLVSIFIIASGLATGGASPVFAALLTDRLQGPQLGFRLGLQNIAYGGGATLGPFLAGALFDRFGNYTLAFALLAASSVISSVIVSTVTVAGRPGSWAAKGNGGESRKT
ncbi:MAG: MFS transporter [candidate division NC10 bacterium]|nr:MFS transporter [candidate division NC10 bacterium]